MNTSKENSYKDKIVSQYNGSTHFQKSTDVNILSIDTMYGFDVIKNLVNYKYFGNLYESSYQRLNSMDTSFLKNEFYSIRFFDKHDNASITTFVFDKNDSIILKVSGDIREQSN
jgi:hypothetical protein